MLFMNEIELIDITQLALWTTLELAGPTMAVALAAGMLIGLVQALTSIQELTLTFVPKLVAVMATLWATADLMAAGLTTFLKRDLVPLMLGM